LRKNSAHDRFQRCNFIEDRHDYRYTWLDVVIAPYFGHCALVLT